MIIKFPVWASIFTVIGVTILCSLGVWQVYRLQWKTEILARIDDAFVRVQGGDISEFLLDGDMAREDFIIGGIFHGYYLHGKEILIQSRVYDGVPGYHVITPFVVLEQERPAVILVNRGWIPVEAERKVGFEILRPEGVVELSGMLIEPPEAKYQPENDANRGMWYRVDLSQFQSSMKIDRLEPKILYVGDYRNEGGEEYPVPVMNKLRFNIRNNHAQYVLFWFAMAVVLVGVYVVRFIVPQMRMR